MTIGIAAMGLSTGAVELFRRRARRAEPDPLSGFPAHRALRSELLTFARSAQRRHRVRTAWKADGEPITHSDDLQVANEGVVARGFELRDVAEALEPVLEQERQRAALIGPTTTARLARLHEYVAKATAILPGPGTPSDGSEVLR